MKDYLNQDNLGTETQQLDLGASEDRTKIQARPTADYRITEKARNRFDGSNSQPPTPIKYGFTPGDFAGEHRDTPEPIQTSTFLDPNHRSKYDINPDFYLYKMFGEEHNRATNQGGWAIAGNAAAKFGVTAAASAVDVLVGDIYGLVQGAVYAFSSDPQKTFWDGFINNDLSMLMNKWKETTYENFQVYNSVGDQAKRTDNKVFNDFGTASFWADDVITNAGYTVGIGLGIAVGKGLGTAAIKNSKMLRRIARVGNSYDVVNDAANSLLKAKPGAFKNVSQAERFILRGGQLGADMGVAEKALRSGARISRINSLTSGVAMVAATSSEARTEAIELGNELTRESDDYINSEEGQLHFLAKAYEKVTGRKGTNNALLLKTMLRNLPEEELNAIDEEALALQDEFKLKSQELSLNAQLGLYTFNFPILMASNLVMYGSGLKRAFRKTPGAIPKKSLSNPKTWFSSFAKDKAGSSSFLISGDMAKGFKLNKLVANKYALTAAGAFARSGSEMGEEMFQQLGTDASTIKYKSDMNAVTLDLLGFKYDPEVMEVGKHMYKGLAQATVGTFGDTFSRADTWLQGLVGAMTGLAPRVSMSTIINKVNKVKTKGGISEWFEGGVIDAWREANESIGLARTTVEKLTPIIEKINNDGFYSYLGANTLLNESIKAAEEAGNQREADFLRLKGIVTDYLVMQEAGKHNEYLERIEGVINDIKELRANPNDVESASQLLEMIENIKNSDPKYFENMTDEQILNDFSQGLQEALVTSLRFNKARKAISNIVGDQNPDLRDELAFKTIYLEKNKEKIDAELLSLFENNLLFEDLLTGLKSVEFKDNIEFNKQENKKENPNLDALKAENLFQLVEQELGLSLNTMTEADVVDMARIIDFLLVGTTEADISPEKFIKDLVDSFNKDKEETTQTPKEEEIKGEEEDFGEEISLDDDSEEGKETKKEKEEKTDKKTEKKTEKEKKKEPENYLAKLLLEVNQQLGDKLMDIANTKIDIADYAIQLSKNSVFSTMETYALQGALNTFSETISDHNKKQQFKSDLFEGKTVQEIAITMVKNEMQKGSSFIEAIEETMSFLHKGLLGAKQDLVFLGGIQKQFMEDDIKIEINKLAVVLTTYNKVLDLKTVYDEGLMTEEGYSTEDLSNEPYSSSLELILLGIQQRFETIPLLSETASSRDHLFKEFTKKEFKKLDDDTINEINETLNSEEFIKAINQALQEANLFTQIKRLSDEAKAKIEQEAEKRATEIINAYREMIRKQKNPKSKEGALSDISNIEKQIERNNEKIEEHTKEVAEKNKEVDESQPEEFPRLFKEAIDLAAKIVILQEKNDILKDRIKTLKTLFDILSEEEKRILEAKKELKKLKKLGDKKVAELKKEKKEYLDTIQSWDTSTIESIKEVSGYIADLEGVLLKTIDSVRNSLDNNKAKLKTLKGLEKDKMQIIVDTNEQVLKELDSLLNSLNNEKEIINKKLDDIIYNKKTIKNPTVAGLLALLDSYYGTNTVSEHFADRPDEDVIRYAKAFRRTNVGEHKLDLTEKQYDDLLAYAVALERELERVKKESTPTLDGLIEMIEKLFDNTVLKNIKNDPRLVIRFAEQAKSINNTAYKFTITEEQYKELADYALAYKEILNNSQKEKIYAQFKEILGTNLGNEKGITGNKPMFISLFPKVTGDTTQFQNKFLQHIINAGTLRAFQDGEVGLGSEIYLGYSKEVYDMGSSVEGQDYKNSYYTIFVKVGDKFLPFNSIRLSDAQEMYPKALEGLRNIAIDEANGFETVGTYVIDAPIGKISGYMSRLDINKNSLENKAFELIGENGLDLTTSEAKNSVAIYFYNKDKEKTLSFVYGDNVTNEQVESGIDMRSSMGSVYLGVLDKAKNKYIPTQINMSNLNDSSFVTNPENRAKLSKHLSDILTPIVRAFTKRGYGENQAYQQINLGEIEGKLDLSSLLYVGNTNLLRDPESKHSDYEVVLRKEKAKKRIVDGKEQVTLGAVSLRIRKINESRTAYDSFINVNLGTVDVQGLIDIETGAIEEATSVESMVADIIDTLLNGDSNGNFADIRFNISQSTTPSQLNMLFETQAVTSPGLNSLDIIRERFAASFDTSSDYEGVFNSEKLETSDTPTGTKRTIKKSTIRKRGERKGAEGVNESGKVNLDESTLKNIDSILANAHTKGFTSPIGSLKTNLEIKLKESKQDHSQQAVENRFKELFSEAIAGIVTQQTINKGRVGNSTLNKTLEAMRELIECL